MIALLVKLLTYWFMPDVMIKTVYGDDKCKTYFCMKDMTVRAIWIKREVTLNSDGTVTGINPGNNAWRVIK